MVEVTKIGASAYALMQQVHKLRFEVVMLDKAAWNEERKQLTHGNLIDLQLAPAMFDHLAGV